MSHSDHLVALVSVIEEELFSDELDPDDLTRMKSPDYSWLYRPSHHIESGLLTVEDIEGLRQEKRLLSVGAFPAYLERVLSAMGVPAENMVVTDVNPALTELSLPMKSVVFDCTKKWPDLGMFDVIMFPESLCIALTDRLKSENIPQTDDAFPTDGREAELLVHIMQESLARLNPDGVIRANGPMSHPNVWKRVSDILQNEFTLKYDRYLVEVRHAL